MCVQKKKRLEMKGDSYDGRTQRTLRYVRGEREKIKEEEKNNNSVRAAAGLVGVFRSIEKILKTNT